MYYTDTLHLLGVASLSETITGSRENGTIFYTPTVNVILK